MAQDWHGLHLVERKFITWDDCAVAVQSWTNDRAEAAELRLAVDDSWVARSDHGPVAYGEHDLPKRAGHRLCMAVVSSDSRLWTGVRIEPGARLEVAITAALGLSSEQSFDQLRDRAAEICDSADHDRIIADQVRSYAAWFAKAPSFHGSDPLLDRTWAYRWFLLRHNLARPGVGRLPGTASWEGRSNKMSKEPWNPGGWEFSKLIPLSSPRSTRRCTVRTGFEPCCRY